MKLRILIVLLIAGIVGVILMGRRHAQPPKTPQSAPSAPDMPRPGVPVHVEGLGTPAPYMGKRFSLPCTFEYPKNWVAGEEEGRGERYQQVIILGPRNTTDTYNAGLIIRVLPTKSAGGTYAGLEALVAWRRAQYAKSEALQILMDRATQVVGVPGTELEWQFTAILPSSRQEPKRTTLRMHTVLLAKGDQLFEFVYSADTADYPHYHRAFDQLLQTLRFSR